MARGPQRRGPVAQGDHDRDRRQPARLGTDYVDLYQIHRWDYDTPIEETLEALHDVVKAGKARYIGASSMHAWQFAKALYVADLNGWTRFVSMQNHYNLLYREEEREMMPLCVDQGVGAIPWSPLARGRLARAWDDPDRARREGRVRPRHLRRRRPPGRRRAARGGQRARHAPGPGRAGLAARPRRRRRADRRGDQAPPPRRRGRGDVDHPGDRPRSSGSRPPTGPTRFSATASGPGASPRARHRPGPRSTRASGERHRPRPRPRRRRAANPGTSSPTPPSIARPRGGRPPPPSWPRPPAATRRRGTGRTSSASAPVRARASPPRAGGPPRRC